ncbi:integrase family protein [Parafrankia sp. EAN1pec]|uniref:tyrosine-type recombinase/integrase n=1 Tax=Parafrankia sp. (strain EAN1pec) TaxID=298653 RepID=UPI000054048E|nr:integrase family protein [Frankia sp. EAN1pec]
MIDPAGTLAPVPSVDLDIVGARDASVSATTARMIDDATAANTKRAYARQWSTFTAWCSQEGRTMLPCSDATLAEYAAQLVTAGAGPATVEQAIATIRRVHRDQAATPPDTRAARLVLRTARRERADAGQATRQAPPAALDQLRAMLAACDTSTRGVRDRALLLLGFAMMGRRSELAALDLADIREVDEGLIVVVRRSKTDQDGRGAEVAVPYGSRPDSCPVRAVRAWRGWLASIGITEGRLFRSVTRHGHIGEAMSGDGIRRAVRAAAVRAGLPNADVFSAHSLRAGGATAAAKAGAPVAAIARQGRWSPTSPVVHSYIRAADRWRDNPMASVGL